MRKLLSAALLAGVGLTCAIVSRPAHAGAFVGVSVGVPVPAVAVVAPPTVAYAPAYYYAGPRVVYPGYVPYAYHGYAYHGFGYHGYGYGYHHGYVGGHAGVRGR